MRRITRFGLPIATLLLLAGAAVLIAQNLQDFTPRTNRKTRPVDEQATAMPASKSTSTSSGPSTAGAHAGQEGATGATTENNASSGSSVAHGSAPNLSTTRGLIMASRISSAPVTTHPYFLEEVTTSDGTQYGITRNSGFFVSTSGGKTWQNRSNGLPVRVVYPFTNDPMATLTSIGVDPRNGERVVVTTRRGIYLSSDAGRSWRPIPVHKPIKSADYFTAVALSPFGPSTIAVGTSFSGVFVTTDAGKTWIDRAHDLGFIYQGAGFYEDVAGLTYSPKERGVLYLGVGFGGGVYRSSPDWKSWTSLHFPGEKNEVIDSVNIRLGAPGAKPASWILDLATQRRYWRLVTNTGKWLDEGKTPQPPPPSAAMRARMKAASGRAGIYISPWDASSSKLKHWITFLKSNGLNTLVVDVKDDHGHITYNTRVPLAHKIGAVHPYFNLQSLIRTAHANGIYVVGRLVVFKDEFMYRYENHRYAIWNPKRNAPWGHYVKEVDKKTGKVSLVQKEFWVDPFSEAVWKYNLSIAEELQRAGIDEIQFDYIRFPSALSSRNALYRFRRKGMTEEDALESFLRMARANLSVPIAVDLFGYNSWYPIAGWVGQDIEVYSNYADVIDPMFYPSLFPSDFLSQYPYLERAKYLYRMGTWRARRIVDGRAIIRPFVQSFLLLPNERKMDKAEYSNYLRTELEGVQAAHASGFLLWNFGTDYFMVTFPLTPYVPK